MKKTPATNSPTAIIRSGCKSYIAIPVKSKEDLRQTFADLVCEQAGEGQQIEERDGIRTLMLVVNNDYAQGIPFGDWVVQYTIAEDGETSVIAVWMAAELTS